MMMDKRTTLSVAVAVLALGMLASGCGSKGAGSPKTGQTQKPVSISATHMGKKQVQGELLFNGTLHAKDEVEVVAETQGKVVKVFIDTGSHVSKGDVLVQIDDELKQAALATAEASWEKSRADWERAQGLFDQKVIAEADRESAKLAFASAEAQRLTARRDVENAKVRASQSGIVTKRSVGVGSMLSGGASVAHIVNADELKLTIQAGERDVLKIHPGQQVAIESDLYPGSTFRGTVTAVSPKGDSALSFPVEISLKTDRRRPLYDGMSAKARIGIGARTIEAIPRVCIVGSFQSPSVYVVSGGIAKLRSLAIGAEYGTDVEVVSGLLSDDLIASNGINNLGDGVSVVIEGDVSK